MVKDYKKYKGYRNVTFIGINPSRTASKKSVLNQVKRYGLKPFPTMLDAGGATAAAYQVPPNAPNWMVIIDGEGKIAYNASKGWHWTVGPHAGKYVHHVQLEKSLATCPGILKIKELPSALEQAAHLFDLQQFDLLEVELVKAGRREKSKETQHFIQMMRDRVTTNRNGRVKQIEVLAKENPVQAYREALAFVQAFPRAPEMRKVRTLGNRLLYNREVKKALRAEAAYKRILVPVMRKCKTVRSFKTRVEPLLTGYLKAFGNTQYGGVARIAVKARGEAVRRGRR